MIRHQPSRPSQRPGRHGAPGHAAGAIRRTMGAPQGRRARAAAIPALVCVVALLANGLWPATPMPRAWARTAPPGVLPLAWCGPPLPAPPSGPASKSHTPHHSPLACPLCQLAHAPGGLPVTAPALLSVARAPVLATPASPDAIVLPVRLPGARGPRAPPCVLHASTTATTI